MALATTIIPPLLEALDLPNVHNLELEIGCPSGFIRKLMARNSDLSIQAINYIRGRYPQVNPSCLVTGKGPMIMSKELRKMLGL